jgi:glycosyltransferase involved in cell wall biosynthesis
MHIAFLISEYPHEKVLHAAGIGTSTKNIVCELVKQGVQVSIFIYGQQNETVFVEDGIKIHLIPYKKKSFLTWYRYRKYLQNYINKTIAADQIDLLEAPDWTGITAFMKLNVPLVIRFHGSDAYFCYLEKRKQKLKNFWFEKLAILNATAFIAPTDFAGGLTRKIFKIHGKPMTTIHNGLPLNEFYNSQPTEYEKGLILYVGTIIRKKGVLELPHILEKVLSKCPEAHLVLIGSDSNDWQSKAISTWELMKCDLSESLLSRIEYVGKIPFSEVKNFIRKANVCVFPTFAETLGMVTIEAMAMRKPVVNSNIGWAPELMEDGVSGFLVDPKNHSLFADRIIELLSDDNLCVAMGAAARKTVEQAFDIQQLAQENISFYQSLISRN